MRSSFLFGSIAVAVLTASLIVACVDGTTPDCEGANAKQCAPSATSSPVDSGGDGSNSDGDATDDGASDSGDGG